MKDQEKKKIDYKINNDFDLPTVNNTVAIKTNKNLQKEEEKLVKLAFEIPFSVDDRIEFLMYKTKRKKKDLICQILEEGLKSGKFRVEN